MSQHWTEKYKHKAKDAFAAERGPKIEGAASKPIPPRPQLTPKGPMRTAADIKVREEMNTKRAKIQNKKKEIQAKRDRDRIQDRALDR